MIKNWLILVFVCLLFNATAQQSGLYNRENFYFPDTANDSLLIKDEPKGNFSISMGSSYITNFNGLGGLSTWIAPSYQFPVNERFTASVGAIMFQNNGFNQNFNNTLDPWLNYQMGTLPNMGALLYASGSYQINQKW